MQIENNLINKIMNFLFTSPCVKSIYNKRLNVFFLLLLVFFQLSGFTQGGSSVRCPSVFSDNMVIQQDINTAVWGNAKNTDRVVIEFAGTKTEALVSNTDGSWMAKLPVFSAGGPFEMKVKFLGTNDSIIFHNVMIGEIWVASGQSNMQFSVPGVKDAPEEIKNAKYPGIRFIQVDCSMSNYPLNDMKGRWREVNPVSVTGLSAVAYFFARQLHQDKKVAVGIIVSAWGGTPVEAWTSADMLSVIPEFRDSIRLYQQRKDNWLALYHAYVKNDSSLRHSEQGEKLGVQKINYKMDDWKNGELPLNTDSMKLGSGYFGGFIWLRKPFNLTEKKSSGKLYTKHVSGEMDVYINGEKLGKPVESDHLRVYTIPKNVLRKGVNILAIRNLSFWVFGKIIGDQKNDITFVANDGSKTVLDGKWFFNETIEPKFPGIPAQKDYPTSLYNAMINPVIPYGIRGVIWYQGESNSGEPAKYQSLFPLLINDWRIRWQLGSFPFLFVQLANFGQRNAEPVSDNWALLREAQTKTLSYPNTGMAVTIDIGDATNIHPKNKQDVGKRLYLAARKVAYKEDIVSSGPMYQNMKLEGNKIRISFSDTGGRLIAKESNSLKGFAVAGTDKLFYWANAVIEGATVVVSSDKVRHPVAVRYAWSTNPECNLYNKEDLPASPFRTDDW